MTDPILPVERAPDAKRAYAEGFKAGGEHVLNSLRAGFPVQTAEDVFLTAHQFIELVVRDQP